MKKTALTINGFAVLVTIASCLVAVGCEKSKGCEEYRPWPTAEAEAAWTAYSPEQQYLHCFHKHLQHKDWFWALQ